jgi:hypothetical protein
MENRFACILIVCMRIYQKASLEIAKNTHYSAVRLTEKRRFGKINIEQDTIPFYVCIPLLLLLSLYLSAKVCVCVLGLLLWKYISYQSSSPPPPNIYICSISPGVCVFPIRGSSIKPASRKVYAYIVAVTQNKMPVANWRSKHPILPLNCAKLKTAVHAWALFNDAWLPNRANNAHSPSDKFYAMKN